MNLIGLFALFFLLLPLSALAQADNGKHAVHLSANDSLEINVDVLNDINFGLNFERDLMKSEKESLFLGEESLSQNYLQMEDRPKVTLAPYGPFTKYNEDPIKGLGLRPLGGYGSVTERNKKIDLNTRFVKRTFSSGPGTAGGSFSFSAEDVLLFIFSKSYRDKLHNAKHANAWKYY